MNAPSKAIEILLIEDNAGDARLAREALLDAKVRNHLTWMPDGVEALAFLRREGPHTAAPRPDLILLDLNLPRKEKPPATLPRLNPEIPPRRRRREERTI